MEQAREYGGFWIRLLALAADTAIMFVASIVILILCSFLGRAGPAVASLALLVIPSLYWPVMHASERQATYGKAMLGLKVTDLEGKRISMMRSFARALAWFVSCFPVMLGFVMAGFTARKQALHDFICSTCVVREGPAHVAGAITVAVVGIVGPMIAIPMFFMALFMGMVAAMFGDMLGEMRRLAPQLEIPVPVPAPKPTAASPKAAAPGQSAIVLVSPAAR